MSCPSGAVGKYDKVTIKENEKIDKKRDKNLDLFNEIFFKCVIWE